MQRESQSLSVEELEAGFRVGEFGVSPRTNTVTNAAGRPRRIEPRAMQVLLQLARHRGDFVAKKALFDTVWRGRCVTEDVLGQAILGLRRAFGDDFRDPRFIETRKNVGYRLIAPVAPRRRAPRRWPLRVAAAGTLVAAGLIWLMHPKLFEDEGTARIGLLPLVTPGAGTEEAFRDRLTAELIDRLAGSSRLAMIAPSLLAEPASGVTLYAAAERHELGFLLEGTVELADGRARARLHLIDAAAGTYVASFQWSGAAPEAAAAAAELSAELERHFSPPRRSIDLFRDLPPRIAEAIAEAGYLLADGTAEDAAEALAIYGSVAAAHPRLAEAKTGAAAALVRLFQFGARPAEALDEAYALANAALELKPSAPAYTTLGRILMFRDWDLVAAERCYRKSLELDPDDWPTVKTYAWLLVAAQRYSEARKMMRRLEVLAPKVYGGTEGARLSLASGDAGGAIAKLERLAAENPPRVEVIKWLAMAHLSAGHAHEAARNWIRFVGLSTGGTTENLDELLRDAGPRAVFQWLLDSSLLPAPAYEASLQAALGRAEAARQIVLRMTSERDPDVLFVNTVPNLQPIVAQIPPLHASRTRRIDPWGS